MSGSGQILIISKCGMDQYQLETNLSIWRNFIDKLPKDTLHNYRSEAIECYKTQSGTYEVPISLYVLFKGDSPQDYYSVL